MVRPFGWSFSLMGSECLEVDGLLTQRLFWHAKHFFAVSVFFI